MSPRARRAPLKLPKSSPELRAALERELEPDAPLFRGPRAALEIIDDPLMPRAASGMLTADMVRSAVAKLREQRPLQPGTGMFCPDCQTEFAWLPHTCDRCMP